MEFKKCSRCGSFYVTNDDVCPNCKTKDELEYNAFKSYVKENGFEEDLNSISGATGITVKNLNRFVEKPEFKEELKNQKNGGIDFEL